MKTTVTKWATKAAGAGAIALLLATPSFAQSRWDGNRNNADRGRQTTDARNGDNRSNTNGYGDNRQANNGYGSNRQTNTGYGDNRQANNDYRENQRVTMSGRVSSFSRERDGYRVQLDRGQSYWVPRSTFGNRDRDLRAGVSISLGGIFRGGSISFDAVSYPGAVAGYGYGNGYAYGNGFVNGVIARIDYRDNTLVVRDQASGRLITAEMTAGGRSNVRNLRPGDYVQMSGQWIGGGVFDVVRINRV